MKPNKIPKSPLPSQTLDTPAFLQDIEQRLKANDKKYKCDVCFEPFAIVPLKRRHQVCLACYEVLLRACPLCRDMVFSNFDACVCRRPTNPATYDVYVLGGAMRDGHSLSSALLHTLIRNNDKWPGGRYCLDGSSLFCQVSKVELVIETIRRHTRQIRRNWFDEGILDDVEEHCTL